jgi:hypothetical protein
VTGLRPLVSATTRQPQHVPAITQTSVEDPSNFGMDPDPDLWIHTSNGSGRGSESCYFRQ